MDNKVKVRRGRKGSGGGKKVELQGKGVRRERGEGGMEERR